MYDSLKINCGDNSKLFVYMYILLNILLYQYVVLMSFA